MEKLRRCIVNKENKAIDNNDIEKKSRIGIILKEEKMRQIFM